MSRIGRKPVVVPDTVTATVNGNVVSVKGPKGGPLTRTVTGPLRVAYDGAAKQILVTREGDDKVARAHHGLWRALIANMVKGVVEGYEKTLEIIGVGYKAELQGRTLKLHLGYAVPVVFEVPQGIDVKVLKPTRAGIDGEIHVSGIDKELVGQFAANVRKSKPPDPYKGKGVRYRGEHVRKLAGKTFGSVGT